MCFSKGAHLGCCRCMFELYELYMLTKSHQALNWLLQAAILDHSRAMEAVGMYCLRHDVGLARYWLSRSTTATAAKALDALGKEKVMTPDECRSRVIAALAQW